MVRKLLPQVVISQSLKGSIRFTYQVVAAAAVAAVADAARQRVILAAAEAEVVQGILL
jgi:hypothetical protein